jgi:DNA-binding transcriptional ArsR family regulator
MNESLTRMFKALGEPKRIDILRAISAAETGRLSPRDHVGARRDASNASYHFRMLERAGLVELVHERPVRGAVQHFFALTARGRHALGLIDAG